VQFRLSHSSSSVHGSPLFNPPAHAAPQFESCVHDNPALAPPVQAFPHWLSAVQVSPALIPWKQVLPHAGGVPGTQPVKLALQFSAPLQKTLSSQNSIGSGVFEHSSKEHASDVQDKPSLQCECCRHSTQESDASLQKGLEGSSKGQLIGVPASHASSMHDSLPLQYSPSLHWMSLSHSTQRFRASLQNCPKGHSTSSPSSHTPVPVLHVSMPVQNSPSSHCEFSVHATH
jgi:hypothetical protein